MADFVGIAGDRRGESRQNQYSIDIERHQNEISVRIEVLCSGYEHLDVAETEGISDSDIAKLLNGFREPCFTSCHGLFLFTLAAIRAPTGFLFRFGRWRCPSFGLIRLGGLSLRSRLDHAFVLFEFQALALILRTASA